MLSRPPAAFAASIRRSAALSRLRILAEDLCDPLLADHRGEAVAAQQQDVVSADRIAPRVDRDGGLGAERAGDDRPLRMLGGLLLGELALADEFVDERVVLGEPFERAVAEQVRAAIADVRDRDVGVLEVGGGEGRSHSREVLLRVRALVDDAVGLADAGGEPLLGAAVVR